MALSWLLGSKKKSEPPEGATELYQDDYVFVERKEETQIDSRYAGQRVYPVLPYALTSDSTKVPQTSSTSSMMNCPQTQNFLNGVPFKLTSDTSFIHDSMNGSRSHADEVLSHILQLNLESFEYDFRVEKSVVLEVRDI
jgi:hypothetical protein